MKKIRQIPRPELEKAGKLTPLELNAIKLDDKHTVLTPELLERLAKTKQPG